MIFAVFFTSSITLILTTKAAREEGLNLFGGILFFSSLFGTSWSIAQWMGWS